MQTTTGLMQHCSSLLAGITFISRSNDLLRKHHSATENELQTHGGHLERCLDYG